MPSILQILYFIHIFFKDTPYLWLDNKKKKHLILYSLTMLNWKLMYLSKLYREFDTWKLLSSAGDIVVGYDNEV